VEKRSQKLKLPQGKELRARLMMTMGTVLLVYMLVSTAQAIWQSYQIDKELVHLRDENADLKLLNKYLQNLIAYRQTDSFKDKEARAKLNYQKQGEAVLIIPEDDIERFTEGNIKDQETKTKRELTNPEKWWQFIFGMDKSA
jgi:biopolymer transport protein ExbB/TolQ